MSVLEGGFKVIHSILLQENVDIVNHEVKKCTLCSKKEKKQSLFDMLTNFFQWNSSNSPRAVANQTKPADPEDLRPVVAE